MRVIHTVAASPQRIVGQEYFSTRIIESESELDKSNNEEVSISVTSSSGDDNNLGATPMQDPLLASPAIKEVPKATTKWTPTITLVVN
jgi:hypothetical protein